jgi:hypothetical protein
MSAEAGFGQGMIHYSLRCSNGHLFDSWFRSLAAFDALASAGQVSCPVCGVVAIEKAPMAPAVVGTRADAAPAPDQPPTADEIAQALAALRRQVEENSDYVGLNFAAEARRIHAGEAPERSIYGETRPDEARKLIEEGVPVAPLPFVARRKLT